MTRIDFYILEDVARSALNRFACRLASQVDDSVKSIDQIAETTLIGGTFRKVRIQLDPAAMATDDLDLHFPPGSPGTKALPRIRLPTEIVNKLREMSDRRPPQIRPSIMY